MAESDHLSELSAAMKRIRTLIDDQHPREALDAVRTLPPRVRASKILMTIEVQLTKSLDDDAAYLQAIERYAAAFPNDSSLDFVRLDSDLSHKRYDAYLAAVDRIDRRVGGDPYLEILRSEAYLASNRPAEAIAHARTATEREPTLQAAWWALVTAQAAGKDFAAAVATLEVLRAKFGARLDPASLSADARFQELVASPDYLAWRARAQPR